MDELPQAIFVTWESAHSEISRLIHDTISDWTYKKNVRGLIDKHQQGY